VTNIKHVHSGIEITVAITAGILSIFFVALYFFQTQIHKITTDTRYTPLLSYSPTPGILVHVYSLPARLLIPKLSIDAVILPVANTASGAMDTPKSNKDTGWYSLGIRPGNIGSAVIAGHLGFKYKGVFKDLHQLVAGDTLSIIDNQGTSASFVVRESRVYEKSDDSSTIFNSNNGAHLNLITCNGDWDTSQATYDKRLVVFSDKI
jgi:LPXTG-site transpeptidase (sortase) family protein